ncbi:MAG: citrate synthase [Paludibacter sp.]
MEKDYLIFKLSETIKTTSRIDKELFTQFNVKRGLRNEDHSGVLVGLTKVGDVVGYEKLPEGGTKAVPGKLFYRGLDVEDLVHGLQKENRLGFEETAFLLLSGYQPDAEELDIFSKILNQAMALDKKATMNIIDLEGVDIMNILARQSIDLIAKFPTIVAYAFNILRHSQQGRVLHIRHPKEGVSLAENFLYMMKGSDNYTELDVKILDLLLILHADHGGGNNSTFTVRVVSSTQTDTYSAIAAGIGSLKGPLHGGANIKVVQMFDHLKMAIKDWKNVKEIDAYLKKMLNKEAYNKSGLIYGIGHAVYTVSDPRALLLKEMARALALEKGLVKEFDFLELLDERSVNAFMTFKGDGIGKQVCTNVDFYSGFVYEAIGLPTEVFTPLFAMARITGWTAHRIEELNFASKRIIRPAYKNVGERHAFIPLDKR